MSKLRPSKLPDFSGQSKILIASHPGRTAAILDNGKMKVMRFKDAHAALDWAESHEVPFFYMPPDRSQRN